MARNYRHTTPELRERRREAIKAYVSRDFSTSSAAPPPDPVAARTPRADDAFERAPKMSLPSVVSGAKSWSPSQIREMATILAGLDALGVGARARHWIEAQGQKAKDSLAQTEVVVGAGVSSYLSAPHLTISPLELSATAYIKSGAADRPTALIDLSGGSAVNVPGVLNGFVSGGRSVAVGAAAGGSKPLLYAGLNAGGSLGASLRRSDNGGNSASYSFGLPFMSVGKHWWYGERAAIDIPWFLSVFVSHREARDGEPAKGFVGVVLRPGALHGAPFVAGASVGHPALAGATGAVVEGALHRLVRSSADEAVVDDASLEVPFFDLDSLRASASPEQVDRYVKLLEAQSSAVPVRSAAADSAVEPARLQPKPSDEDTARQVSETFERYLAHRGDDPNTRQGTDLINEVGTAMHFAPNHVPKSAEDVAALEAGRWPFFEGKAAKAAKVVSDALVRAAGGRAPVRYTILPIVHRDQRTGATTSLPLFRVHRGDKSLLFVDNLGRSYQSLAAWRQENRLPEGSITFPKGGRLSRGKDGKPELEVAPARAVWGSPGLAYAADKVDQAAMIGGLIVGTATFIGVGGALIPMSAVAMSAFYASRSLYRLHDGATHGKPAFDAETRGDWLSSVASLASLGASAATIGVIRGVAATGQAPAALAAVAPGLIVGSRTIGAVKGGKLAVETARNWQRMSPKQRMMAIAQIGFFSAGMARQLTTAHGVASLFSLDEVRYQLGIEARPDMDGGGGPEWIRGAPESLGHKLRTHNVYEEREHDLEAPSTTELFRRNAYHNTLDRWLHDGRLFLDGTKARVLGGLFVNLDHRTDGDFRYAYGRSAFKGFEAAERRLSEIPPGGLADALSIELLDEVNALTYVATDDQGWPQLAHLMHYVEGRPVHGGELREDYQSRSLPWEMKPHQVQNVKELGLGVSTVHVGPPGQLAVIYPEGSKVRANVQEILDQTRERLLDPEADPVETAAYFSRHLVAQHPNMDGNGRTIRALMYRILEERGLPPPMLSDLDNDVALSQQEYAEQIRLGIARTIEQTWTSHWGEDSFLTPVQVGGERFVLDEHGFMRDVAGRAHIVDQHGHVAPLSQMLSYLVDRRLDQAGPTAADSLTLQTRERFTTWQEQPTLARDVVVNSDLDAMEDDRAIRVGLPRGEHAQFIRLFDLSSVGDDVLFGNEETELSEEQRVPWVVSRHQQLDLELWHMMSGLRHAGDHEGAKEIMRYREHLFERAKAELEGTVPAQEFQQMALDRSPLRYSSLREAIRHDGDDTLTVWRGALPTSRLGMYNDHNPLTPDARGLAELRGQWHSVGNLTRDLHGVEGSTLGTGYLSTSSDLSIYTTPFGFSDGSSYARIEFGKLPEAVRSALEALLPEGKVEIDRLRDVLGIAAGRPPAPPGALEISGIPPEQFESAVRSNLASEPAQAEALIEAFHARLEEAGLRSWGDRLRAWMTDEPVYLQPSEPLPYELEHELNASHLFVELSRSHNGLDVELQRRLYEVRLDKRDALPGIETVGHGPFEDEQEITSAAKIYPWQVRNEFTRAQLLAKPAGAKGAS